MWVEIQSTKTIDGNVHRYWANLLFMREDTGDANYMTFKAVSSKLCKKDNIYCLAVFDNLSFIGYLCFSIILIGMILQMIDLTRMIYYVVTSGKIV
jgi:hypothetical protein